MKHNSVVEPSAKGSKNYEWVQRHKNSHKSIADKDKLNAPETPIGAKYYTQAKLVLFP